MTDPTWTLFEADAEECELFARLASTLRRAGARAAPPNRWREVHRIDVGGRTWYLKTFHRTQAKNALHLRCSRPPARTEAEREATMAQALRAAGFDAPRVVAVGRDGRRSYFLCAALAGAPLLDRLNGPQARTLLLRAASEAGRAARTFSLPDLSAEHVFVVGERGGDTGVAPQFAFLDLHNAYVRRASARTLRRLLRHSGRSLRDLPIGHATIMRAAVVLLRAAGSTRRDRRRALAAQPPWRTHARYDVPGKSDAYRERDRQRTQRELAMLAAVWPGRPGESVLDCPCGTGRLLPFLRQRQHAVVGADRSRAMLRAATDVGRLLCADAARLPLPAGGVHGVVTFRFLHHLDADSARRVAVELARVAERWLVISVFHPRSAHGLWRRLCARLTGRARTRFSLSPRRLAAWLADVGFVLDGQARQGALRDLCVLSFRRTGASN